MLPWYGCRLALEGEHTDRPDAAMVGGQLAMEGEHTDRPDVAMVGMVLQ